MGKEIIRKILNIRNKHSEDEHEFAGLGRVMLNKAGNDSVFIRISIY